MLGVRIDRADDRYALVGPDGRVRWSVPCARDVAGNPFREALVWSAGGCVAIGEGGAVRLHAIDSGALLTTVSLDDDHFGHFGPSDLDVLYVLGWRHVLAIDHRRELLWRRRNVAIDGIVWSERRGGRLVLSAEMDPPGGWVAVELEAATGAELARHAIANLRP